MRKILIFNAQAGRRYPQSRIGADRLFHQAGAGTTPTLVVQGDNLPISIDLPELGTNAPGTVQLGGSGGLT